MDKMLWASTVDFLTSDVGLTRKIPVTLVAPLKSPCVAFFMIQNHSIPRMFLLKCARSRHDFPFTSGRLLELDGLHHRLTGRLRPLGLGTRMDPWFFSVKQWHPEISCGVRKWWVNWAVRKPWEVCLFKKKRYDLETWFLDTPIMFWTIVGSTIT